MKWSDVMSDPLQPHELNPWISPGQNTGVDSLSLLQGIFPTQGSNPGLPHCRQILYQLSHKGSTRIHSGPILSPGDLPNPGIEPGSPALQADSLSSELSGKPWIQLNHYNQPLLSLKSLKFWLGIGDRSSFVILKWDGGQLCLAFSRSPITTGSLPLPVGSVTLYQPLNTQVCNLSTVSPVCPLCLLNTTSRVWGLFPKGHTHPHVFLVPTARGSGQLLSHLWELELQNLGLFPRSTVPAAPVHPAITVR